MCSLEISWTIDLEFPGDLKCFTSLPSYPNISHNIYILRVIIFEFLKYYVFI